MAVRMRIIKFIPDRMFGFAVDPAGLEVFFHLGVFDPRGPIHSDDPPPPPILGEEVDVTLPEILAPDGRAPRALRVQRLTTAVLLSGVVEAFNPRQGYGFVRGADGLSYHLHHSEMASGHIPQVGDTVDFYGGVRMERPRACHVKVR